MMAAMLTKAFFYPPSCVYSGGLGQHSCVTQRWGGVLFIPLTSVAMLTLQLSVDQACAHLLPLPVHFQLGAPNARLPLDYMVCNSVLSINPPFVRLCNTKEMRECLMAQKKGYLADSAG